MDLRNARARMRVGSFSWRPLISALAALLLALPLLLGGVAPAVEAAGPSNLVPFLRVVIGWRNRNRVYRTVNPFIAEKQAYYDALHAKALEQLAAREVRGLRDSQVAAFVKVAALIMRERQATIDFAESEKRAARETFIDTLEDEIKSRMLASTPATRVLGALGKGVRSSRDLIDRALTELAGASGGAMAEVVRARRIAARVTIAGQLVGGKLGERIRRAGARVVELIDQPTGEIEAGLVQAQEELGNLEALVEDLQAQGYQPTASEVGQEVLITLITGDEASPAVQAIVDMLVAKSGREGDFRKRARDAILGGTAARCAVKAQQIRQVILRLEMDIAGDEDQAGDERDLPICQVIDLGGADEAVAAAPTATPTVGIEASPTPAPTVTEPPPAAVGDFYTGALELARRGNAPIWEVVDSEVVLEIVDGVLYATIEYTQRSTIRQGGDTDGVCNATFTRKMSGEGPLTSPASLEVHVELSEILAFDGTICDAGGGWKTTAEEDLMANLDARRTMSLEGDFSDGRFTGSLAPSPYAVVAVRAER
jgi:hypothetical protein